LRNMQYSGSLFPSSIRPEKAREPLASPREESHEMHQEKDLRPILASR
jgi:hypothetical protein